MTIAVKLKPLEWTNTTGFSTAQTPFHFGYSVWNARGRWECNVVEGSWRSRALAQRASEADYERRVLSVVSEGIE